MSFVINLNIISNGYQSSYISNNTKPTDVLEFHHSLVASLNYEIGLMNYALNSSSSCSEAVVESIMKSANYPLIILGGTFPAGSLSERHMNIDRSKHTPPVMNSEGPIKIVTPETITSIGTIFSAPSVQLKCADRLYIEDNYFNCSTLIINDRELTPEEILNISQRILDKCSIGLTLTVSLDQDAMPNQQDVRESISTDHNLKEVVLNHISDLEQQKQSVTELLESYNTEFTKCQSDYVSKIIDIPCSAVAAYNFLADF